MPIITRRQLGASAIGLALAPGARAAELPEATRNLPRRYAGTTLNIVWGPEPTNAALAEFSREFMTATGINIQWTNVAHSERYQKIILDLTSGTNSFDLYLNAYQWKQELAPFVIDHAHLDQEVAGAPPMDLADYPPHALEVYGRVGDKMVAIPLKGDVTFLVWNKKAFAAAGLDPEVGPKSWDEVVRNGEKLRAGDQFGYNLPGGKNIQAACQWITLFHGLGGRYLAADGTPDFGSQAGIGSFKLMAERLGRISPPGNITWDNPEMINAVSTGHAAQGFMWPGGFSTLLDPAHSVVADSLGYAPTPQAALLGGWAISVNAKSRNLDAAKLFAAWLTCKQNGTRIVPLTGQPARISAFQDPEAVRKFPALPAVLAGMSGPVAEYPPIKQSEQLCIFIFNEANAVCSGTKTAETAAADLQTHVYDFMKRRGLLKG